MLPDTTTVTEAATPQPTRDTAVLIRTPDMAVTAPALPPPRVPPLEALPAGKCVAGEVAQEDEVPAEEDEGAAVLINRRVRSMFFSLSLLRKRCRDFAPLILHRHHHRHLLHNARYSSFSPSACFPRLRISVFPFISVSSGILCTLHLFLRRVRELCFPS